MGSSTTVGDLVALVPQQLEDLTNALTATYDASAGSLNAEAAQRLAASRDQLMSTCDQLRDQLVSSLRAECTNV